MLNRLTKLAVVAVVLAVMGSWGCSASTSPSDPGEDEKKPSQQPVDEKQPEQEPDKPKTPRPPPEPLQKVPPPAIDAQAAAAAAIELYDKDGNGTIGSEELQAAPALAAALADLDEDPDPITNLDEDQDGAVTQEEIVARITAWQDSKIGVTDYQCQVTLDGDPLIGATVTLVPEAFLGSEVQTASGVTGEEGIADISIADLPKGKVGAHCGFYRVRVSKLQDGKELIPAKYNAETILGEEISEEEWDVPTFELASE
ncbi:MAG: hypothetical protein HQ581_24280 [Planctomycetes bacterium]|nr:hypothetical protein [Planctomycetota bacterium]